MVYLVRCKIHMYMQLREWKGLKIVIEIEVEVNLDQDKDLQIIYQETNQEIVNISHQIMTQIINPFIKIVHIINQKLTISHINKEIRMIIHFWENL